ncbi:MAG: hypothetical protein RLZZ230_874 [Candidatus Parcubacteria bacterium]|jgi:hypothetical protein
MKAKIRVMDFILDTTKLASIEDAGEEVSVDSRGLVIKSFSGEYVFKKFTKKDNIYFIPAQGGTYVGPAQELGCFAAAAGGRIIVTQVWNIQTSLAPGLFLQARDYCQLRSDAQMDYLYFDNPPCGSFIEKIIPDWLSRITGVERQLTIIKENGEFEDIFSR